MDDYRGVPVSAIPPSVLNGTVPPSRYCFEHPDYDVLCDHVGSFYSYRIDIAANAAFLGLFAASLLGYAAVIVARRGRGLAVGLAMILGLVCEVLGYAGRVMSWRNRWDENGFLMQICCLTIGPAFMAAGLYLCLRRIVTAFGPENSRIPPEYYTRIVCFSPLYKDGPYLISSAHSSSPATSSRSSSRPPAAAWPPSPSTAAAPPPPAPTS